jgi:hypothetical protein
MKDFLGNDLQEDDEVVVCVGHGRNSGASMSRAKIVGFTTHFVVVDLYKSDGTLNINDRKKTHPSKVVKI